MPLNHYTFINKELSRGHLTLSLLVRIKRAFSAYTSFSFNNLKILRMDGSRVVADGESTNRFT